MKKPERVFMDTNLFLRFLTNDIPAKADAVEELLRRAGSGQVLLVTNGLVIAEIVWTLEGYYGLTRESVREKILAILNTPGLEIQDAQEILQATIWHHEKNVDFIDAYNVAWMTSRGILKIATFDKKHFDRFPDIQATIPGNNT
ncbi:MAG: PIN domain-containing protein [bacterium]